MAILFFITGLYRCIRSMWAAPNYEIDEAELEADIAASLARED